MNGIVLLFAIWCTFQALIAIVGLYYMKDTCTNLTLFDNLRYLLSISASIAAVFYANLSCNYFCHDDDENTSKFIFVVAGIFAIVILGFESTILSNIDADCMESHENYYTFVSYGGILSTVIAGIVGWGGLFYSTRNWRHQKNLERQKRHANEARKALAERQKLAELERQSTESREAELETNRKRKEFEVQQALSKKELARKQMMESKAAQDRIDALHKADQENAQKALRITQGNLTAEERIAKAKADSKNIQIAKAEQRIASIENKITNAKSDTEALRYESELNRAKYELNNAKRGNQYENNSMRRLRPFGQPMPFGQPVPWNNDTISSASSIMGDQSDDGSGPSI